MRPTFFLIFYLILLKSASSQITLQNISELFPSPSDPLLNPQFIQILTTIINTLPNSTCFQQLQSINTTLEVPQKWAISMLDATAKPQSGILMGNIMHVGNYDECIEINDKEEQIQGKYCSAIYQPHSKYGDSIAPLFSKFFPTDNIEENHFAVSSRLSYGFCIPASCKAEELQLVVDLAEEYYQSPLHFSFHDEFCDAIIEELPLTRGAIAAITLFSIFAIIVILSTFYDVLLYQEKRGTNTLYTAFSIYTNGLKLLAITEVEGNLGCLNGIRVISMMWVVLGHSFMHAFFLPQVNATHMLKWRNATENALILGGTMSVDTFFTISGLLVTYLFLKSVGKGVKFSIPMFYLHRILRLMPSLIMVVIFSGTLLRYMGSGPFWPVAYEMYQKPCETNWWITLLYLQNYVETTNQCVGQAWYLAVDTQMYFISPLILIPLVKWPKRTITVLLVYVVLCTGYVFEITYKKHFGSVFFDESDDRYAYLYSPTHVRGVVYVMGMITGYFVYQTKNNPIKLCKPMVAFLWIFSLGVMLTIVLVHSIFVKYEYNVVDSSVFNALSRPGWCIGLSIIIILCINGYGGIVDKFLSYPLFTVLIRLNYNIYLLHLLVMMVKVAQGRTPVFMSNLVVFHMFWGDFAFTVFIAVIWTLTFESPIIILEKLLLGKGGKNKSSNKNGLENPQFRHFDPSAKLDTSSNEIICPIQVITTTNNN